MCTIILKPVRHNKDPHRSRIWSNFNQQNYQFQGEIYSPSFPPIPFNCVSNKKCNYLLPITIWPLVSCDSNFIAERQGWILLRENMTFKCYGEPLMIPKRRTIAYGFNISSRSSLFPWHTKRYFLKVPVKKAEFKKSGGLLPACIIKKFWDEINIRLRGLVRGLVRKGGLGSSLRSMVETLPERSGGRIESNYFFGRQRKIQWIFDNVLIFLNLIAVRA